jgi:glycosyltransferase involved in cell wall biosynthesis
LKVLQANKFHYVRGGADRYFLDLVEILPGHGHPTAPFSMRHPRNQPTPFSRYFVSRVDYTEEGGRFGALATAARTVYNRETRRRVRELVEQFRPDVAHLHNVHHQLSGSLFEVLDELGVPAVQTLHDFQWVCPVYTFLREGRICEECGHGRTFPGVRHRCQGGSLARSVVAALAVKVGWWRRWEGMVARFLAPSRFLAGKVVEHGLPAGKVVPLNYCLRLEGYRPGGERGRHALYAGRLSAEKGVETLLKAAARVPGLSLRIAGTGPLEPDLRQLADTLLPGRTDFLGHLHAAALREELARAAFAVVPSEWYENQPYAVLEAFAMGTPVLGSDLGGIPELVRPGETGQLFPAGSVGGLAEALAVMQGRGDLVELGRAAREWVATRFDPDRHAEALVALYTEVLAEPRGRESAGEEEGAVG